ncbi:MAG: sugar phosphate isomerase/epimerase [Clostridia bacterium]|nr:sugar phosphate isomerase/epimerase [Clostridia bacterium]
MIGLTSTTLRKYSLEEVADISHKAGAEMIEWGSDFHVKTVSDAEKAKKLCDEREIVVNSYGTYYKIGCGDLEQWKKICEISAAMGAKYIRTWLGEKGSDATGEKLYSAIVEQTLRMADEAEKYSLVICNECHPNTYNDTTESTLRYLRDVNRENVKTYYQSWYHDEPGDREKLFSTFPYVQDVHVSFSELDKFQLLHKKDKQYIDKILSWLKQLGFNNSIMIEFTKGGNAENLIKDIERLKQIWKTV